jgi:FtsZ-interacting cell division protein YlmF
MKNKLRQAMSFLGLVEDEYNDFAPQSQVRPSYEPEEREFVAEGRPFPTMAPRTSPQSSMAPRPVAPQVRPRQASPISVLDSAGSSTTLSSGAPRVRSMPGVSSFSAERDVVVFVPTQFNDSSRITDSLRQNRCVLLKVAGATPTLQRRVVDYACGTAFALNARIEPLREKLYLIVPNNMHVDPETKDRLRDSL